MTEIHFGLIKKIEFDKNTNKSTLYVLKDKKTEQYEKAGELTKLIGAELYFDDDKKIFIYRFKQTLEETTTPIELGEKIGEVHGDTNLKEFSFKVTNEKAVKVLTFVGLPNDVFGQIMDLERVNGMLLARVEVLGQYKQGRLQILELPVKAGSPVNSVTNQAMQRALKFDKEGLYLGCLHKTNIKFYANPDDILNSHCMAIGIIRVGKSYGMHVFVEAFADRGIPSIIWDARGEHDYNFENDVPEELVCMKHFEVEPKSYANNFLKFSFNPNHQQHELYITLEHFAKDNFYKDFLIRPGQISALQVKSLSKKDQLNLLGLLSEKLYWARVNNHIPPTLFVIEEAERYLPEGKSSKAIDETANIAFQGAQAALGLAITAHRISAVTKNVTTQIKNHLVFKTTADLDINRLKNSVQGVDRVTPVIKQMPVGACLASGDFVQQPFLVDVRIAKSKHFGQSVSVKDELFDQLALKKTQELQDKLGKMVD